MRAFVIRGFGLKAGIDFERVHEELIRPALDLAGIEGGGTTGEIVEAGNIREDMFTEIVLADLVVADISVQNANVFYELGIRHAMRDRATVLIRARIDDVPFDLKTDRYMEYDPAAAADSVPRLAQVLRETLGTERIDSPVFQLLPKLAPSPYAPLLSLPRELAEDIEQARRARNAGVLRLLADEVKGLRFEEAALRTVARASEYVGDDVSAQRIWELIRAARPGDQDANYALANIYRGLGLSDLSDLAITRALGGGALTSYQRAELHALRASNSKRLWCAQWRAAGEQDRARVALRDPELRGSFRHYRQGFDEDLNNWYPGLNALAMASIRLALADRCADAWQAMFPDDRQAAAEYRQLESEKFWLASTVQASLEAARSRLSRSGSVDSWLEVSVADLEFLLGNEPDRIASAYEAAVTPALGSNTIRSIREQIEIYRDLDIFADKAEAVLTVLPLASPRVEVRVHPLVFSGHTIDAPGRGRPRFPAGQEDTARAAIEESIRSIYQAAQDRGRSVVGLAGISSGGDLLFHEVCRSLGIETWVFLPVPETDYRVMAIPDPAWAERYHSALGQAATVLTLARAGTLPGWLISRTGYSTWHRSNRWILHHAWATTTDNRVTVLALWDGNSPGLVADMVATATGDGAEVVTLDTIAMFGLAGAVPEAGGDGGEGPAADAEAEPGTKPETETETEDRVRDLVWRCQRQWSAAADTAQAGLNRWRQRNLALLMLGALAAAVAAQTWLSSVWTAVFAAASAGLLALAGLVQGQALAAENTERWTGARAASEALKAEIYRYLARVGPYADDDRAEKLREQLDAVQNRARTLLTEQQLADPGDPLPPLPEVRTFADYLARRAQGQAKWHRDKIAEHRRTARRLHSWQLVATAAGAVLAAVGAAMPGWHLSAWTAAATTIAASVGVHIAATRHERIAASYAATTDQLDRLIGGVDPSAADTARQAQFAADVERVLATQNEGWTDLLGPAGRPGS